MPKRCSCPPVARFSMRRDSLRVIPLAISISRRTVSSTATLRVSTPKSEGLNSCRVACFIRRSKSCLLHDATSLSISSTLSPRKSAALAGLAQTARAAPRGAAGRAAARRLPRTACMLSVPRTICLRPERKERCRAFAGRGGVESSWAWCQNRGLVAGASTGGRRARPRHSVWKPRVSRAAAGCFRCDWRESMGKKAPVLPAEASRGGACDHNKEPSTTAPSANESDLSTQQVDLLCVGSVVVCASSFDSHARPAEVIERRTCDGVTEVYVHYLDLDRRLDEWVPASKVSSVARSELLSPESICPADARTPSASQQKLTRRLKRRIEEVHHVHQMEDLSPLDQTLEREHHEKTKVKNVNVIELGRFEMDTWYYAPFPEPYNSYNKLYLCEFCLKYFRKDKSIARHAERCPHRSPPGQRIYSSPEGFMVGGAVTDPRIAMYEVDGAENKLYCQNLCLLSKLFLDHKTLYFDVEHFLFYVLCEEDEHGSHLVGYFSKEKHSTEDYNLACILTLPPYQRKGYGRFLIAFSYALSQIEGKVGTPERPLSDLGAVSYRSYWTRVLLETLRQHRSALTIREMSRLTSIRQEDVIQTLQSMNMLKYYRGHHILNCNQRIVEEHLRGIQGQRVIEIDRSRLHWQPRVWPLPPHMAKRSRGGNTCVKRQNSAQTS